MRTTILLIMLSVVSISLVAQTKVNIIKGNVSYVTSQNIYVKFKSTKNIKIGDTLFINKDDLLQPALIVNNTSSISCVCRPIIDSEIKNNDVIISKTKELINNKTLSKAISLPLDSNSSKIISDSIIKIKENPEQKLNGRFTIASYSDFSNTSGKNRQRMRYTLALNVQNISESKFSFDSYISFSHSNTNWDAIQSNIFNGLKIYNFAVKYQASKSLNIFLGRRINSNISNIGAIDGIQAEKRLKSFYFGAFVGSRPDYLDYSYNINLLQGGAYIGHVFVSKSKRQMRSTMAFVEQKNNGKTDRRFIYLQHYNSLAKNLSFFGTAELELYQKVNGAEKSSFNLSNLYLMLRYRPIRKLSLSLSYSARQNIIYYETYKDFVDRLIDEATLQGYKFQINYRLFKRLSIGVRTGYRYRKDDPRPSRNVNTYVSYSRIPWINASGTISAMLLETAYLSGGIYSLKFSRDIIPGKLFGGLGYRFVNYKYSYIDSSLNQHIGDINMTLKIIKKLSFSVSYESVFENSSNYNRLYLRLSTRF